MPGMMVAIVGAGGKTTSLFALARSLPGPVYLTTTTHLGAWQAAAADRHVLVHGAGDILAASGVLAEKVVLFTGPAAAEQRLAGLQGAPLDALRALTVQNGATLLIEADGARQRMLKAPGDREPVIPDWVDLVIVVAGMGAIGAPLDDATIHRPALFAERSGLERGAPVSPDAVARVLLHPQGGRKGIPSRARSVALLNQAETDEQRGAALQIANAICGVYDAVVIAALQTGSIHAVIEPAAAVILAAGGATRFGAPKILLPWQGKPLVRHVAETALAAQMSPVLLVLGAVDEPAREALAGLPVQIVSNPHWQAGQSTSLRAGLAALPQQVGAAIFLLADQPSVTPALLRALIEQRQATRAPVVAPLVDGQRANPVLFGRETFSALASVTGDQGGRAIFRDFSPSYVEWLDDSLLRDIDTPQDYAALRGEDPGQ